MSNQACNAVLSSYSSLTKATSIHWGEPERAPCTLVMSRKDGSPEMIGPLDLLDFEIVTATMVVTMHAIFQIHSCH